jgi:Fur family transcriptional regulator, zinc uptake regulator
MTKTASPPKPAAARARSTGALTRAERICTHHGERLTPSRRRVYSELLRQPRPISAYDLLSRLEKRERRKLSPLTVYRALDFLMRVGLVHKLESQHSFVACDHPEDRHHGLYLVCSSCGRADELDADAIDTLVHKAARARGFRPEKQIVEVQGVCQACSSALPAG